MASTRRLAAILAAFFIPTVLVLPLLVTHAYLLVSAAATAVAAPCPPRMSV